MELNKYMDELANYDFAVEFGDYDSGIICDIINEIADNAISIYTKDQIDFAMNNHNEVEQAFLSGIAPDAHDYIERNNGNFYGYVAAVGAAAWYEHNATTIYENIEECVLYAVCKELETKYGITELTEDNISDIEFISVDSNDRLEDIIEEAVKLINNEEED